MLFSFSKQMILLYLVGLNCDNLANSMFNVINGNRSSNGLNHLKSIQNLENAARDQALYMCENSNLTHDNPQGDLQQRVKRNGFKGYSIGENIAKSHSDNYNEVAKIWMDSPRHKKNILGDFNYTGIATCLDRKGARYWVQVFGKDTKSNDTDSSVVLEDNKNNNENYSKGDDDDSDPYYRNNNERNNNGRNNNERNRNERSNSGRNRRRTMPEITYRIPEILNGYCFRLEDCAPNQTMISSIGRPDGFTVTKYKTSFVPISTPVFASEPTVSTTFVYLTSTSAQPVVTITKTTSVTVERKDPPKSTTSTASQIKETVTVTKENVLTVTQSVEKVTTVTKDVENIVTVTRMMKMPNTSTYQIEKAVSYTIPVTQTYQMERSVERPYQMGKQNDFMGERSKPKFIQLIPEREISIDNLIQPTEMMNSDNTVDSMENSSRRRPVDENDKRMRNLLSGDRTGFLNMPCGTRDNPCIKTLFIRG